MRICLKLEQNLCSQEFLQNGIFWFGNNLSQVLQLLWDKEMETVYRKEKRNSWALDGSSILWIMQITVAQKSGRKHFPAKQLLRHDISWAGIRAARKLGLRAGLPRTSVLMDSIKSNPWSYCPHLFNQNGNNLHYKVLEISIKLLKRNSQPREKINKEQCTWQNPSTRMQVPFCCFLKDKCQPSKFYVEEMSAHSCCRHLLAGIIPWAGQQSSKRQAFQRAAQE